MFEFDTNKEKVLNFKKLSVKQRLEWWNSSMNFIIKLPEKTRKFQKKIRNKDNWNTEFEDSFKNNC